MSDSRPTPTPAWLQGLGPADLGVYAAVVALLTLAGVTPAAWRWADPSLRASLRYYATDGPGMRLGQDALDPWGQRWVLDDGPPRSVGLNGRDERGAGDDLPIEPPVEQGNWRLRLHDALAGLLCIAALLLLSTWELARLVRRQLLAPWSDVPTEARRAAGWALPLGAIACGGLVAFGRLDGTGRLAAPLRAWLEEVLVVPVPVALFGSTTLAAYLLVLGLRLRLAPRSIARDSDSALQGRDPDGR